MSGVKWLLGLAATGNGTANKPWRRDALVLVSLGDYVATAALNGTPADPNVAMLIGSLI